MPRASWPPFSQGAPSATAGPVGWILIHIIPYPVRGVPLNDSLADLAHDRQAHDRLGL